jgi:hypothetical protein
MYGPRISISLLICSWLVRVYIFNFMASARLSLEVGKWNRTQKTSPMHAITHNLQFLYYFLYYSLFRISICPHIIICQHAVSNILCLLFTFPFPLTFRPVCSVCAPVNVPPSPNIQHLLRYLHHIVLLPSLSRVLPTLSSYY